jgi:hypothetical protein
VPLAQQAVEVNGRLAAQFPAKYRARHVAALTNLAAALYATGNRAGSAQVQAQAAAISRMR